MTDSEITSLIDSWKVNKLIKEVTDVELLVKVIQEKKKVYLGIDPTSDSLHIGHLVVLNLLKKISELGCQAIILIGDYTCRIGDPSFQVKQRLFLDQKTIASNSAKIIKQIKKILPNCIVVQNSTWYKKTNLFDFLIEVGKLFTVNKMLEKQSLSVAFQQNNLFYSSFSYILLQAYDFYYLWRHYGCFLQIGGSDQYPNIVFGINLIHKLFFVNCRNYSKADNKIWTLPNVQVCGLTTNLLLNSKGNKISKSSESDEQIWLDPQKTAYHDIYQFFYNLDDLIALEWIKMFGFIQIIDSNSKPNNKERFYQKQLFFAVADWIFGSEKLSWIKECLEIIQKKDFSAENLNKIKSFLPFIKQKQFKEETILNLLTSSLKLSKTKVLQMIESKMLKINDEVVFEPYLVVSEKILLNNNILIIKKGKKKIYLVSFGE